ncbi:aspartate/glutamate racemase family protein [Halomonas denitrificans]|uniref:aspartate/glutamate racemase family protein n=1 Tax=Halomonas TaxID=2745 RepID=UPI001C9511AD|nr:MULTISPECIES: aspartate/glutamate racemase family protein [Halomonas]MBY5926659.1 aspartate/glutamate racemase family protein [Halomonas sp. DP4Y7-2]MBY6206029.1 aspartate/glutamate racemase family protein [Halomonas sp. DP3Y7-2]MBY6228080.1 aspartate/glutamate racemase family protein [Halomonas sp. DP3Y7-1]MBY6233628.1 aspartate/glutamate racemase family protein [Halomonas sp. DP4Y7-1]MCA0916146.1 aspartate/glutamate racemase family protein [Halomonas denitrificans]
MKLLVINPNISESVTTLIEREARLSLRAGVQLSMATAPFGVAYIETRAEALIGGYATLGVAAERYPGHDAVVVAAFGDPGLAALREALPVPVVGLTEAALMSACQLGGRFSIIAISQRIQAWYRETVESHGLSSRLASIRALDQPLPDIGNVQLDQGTRLIELAERAVRDDGADVLILAGAPLAGLARDVADRLPVPALDGVSCAIVQAQALVELGRGKGGVAKAGSYAPPPSKASLGLGDAMTALIGRQPT